VPLQNPDKDQNSLAFQPVLPYNIDIVSTAGTGGSMADETHDRQNPQTNDNSNPGRNISIGGNVGGNIIR
jgi:hypothetical protein